MYGTGRVLSMYGIVFACCTLRFGMGKVKRRRRISNQNQLQEGATRSSSMDLYLEMEPEIRSYDPNNFYNHLPMLYATIEWS